MLRNKLSKLIVSIMAAVMIAGAGVSGQAVKATTVQTQGQAQQGQTTEEVNQVQTKTVFEIDGGTTQPDIENKIKDTAITTIRVKTNVEFPKNIIDALNARTTPLTIEIVTGGSIKLPTGISLDGKGILTISRGTGVKGSLIIFDGDVTISGVNFKNGLSMDHIIDKGTKNQVNRLVLDKNTLDMGTLIPTSLIEETTDTNNTFIDGKSGLVKVIDSIEIGQTHAIVKGNIAGIAQGTEVYVEFRDVSTQTGKIVSEKIIPDNNGNFSVELLGLDKNTKYNIVVKFINNGINKEIKISDQMTKNLKTTHSATSTSVTIQIPAGLIPTTQKTELVITSGNTTIPTQTVTSTQTTTTVNGLSPNTKYDYKLVYTIPAPNNQSVVLSTDSFTTANSSLVTGGGNNGSSTIVTPQITSNDISRSTIKDVTATLEVSNNTAYNSLRDAREITTNIKGVTATFTNGKLELKGLVPEKEYSNLDITYINRDGRKGTIKVAKFTTKKSETKIRQFVTDVYRYALDRLADEEGFAYWVNGLEKKTITPDTLVKNLLNEKEFIEKHKTTESKIEGLYQVIVNRKSDAEGLKFWTNKYDGLIKTGYSDAMALRILVDQMVNEQEFKNRVKDLGL